MDICRTAASENGLIVADAALREWCSPEELSAVVEAYPRSPGNRPARSLIAIAGDRSESVGETLTKKCILDAGIASLYDENDKLLQQIEFYDREGFVARVDCYLPALNLVIEFDGAMKYSAGAVQVAEQVLNREQAREKRLKNMYLDLLRLQWNKVISGNCVDNLRLFAEQQRQRIRRGGLVFSDEVGRWREDNLPYKIRALRSRRIEERAARRGAE